MSKLVPVAACLAGIALLRFLFRRDETHNESQATFNAKKVADAIENALNLDPEFTVMTTHLDDHIGFHCTLNPISWGLRVRRSPATHDCEDYEIRLSSSVTQRGGELIDYFHPESFIDDMGDIVHLIKHAMAALIEDNDRKNMDESIASLEHKS